MTISYCHTLLSGLESGLAFEVPKEILNQVQDDTNIILILSYNNISTQVVIPNLIRNPFKRS